VKSVGAGHCWFNITSLSGLLMKINLQS